MTFLRKMKNKNKDKSRIYLNKKNSQIIQELKRKLES